MDEQTVEGVADTHTTGLGIIDNRLAHLQVTVLVEVSVHHTCSRLDHWHTGCITHEVDKLSAATWDAEVDITDSVQHLARSLMGGRQQGNDVFRYAELLEHLVNQGHLLAIRTVGVLASFQHTGITTLKTEGEDIERDIRAGFVDHADDSKGYADTTETQTVGQGLLLGDVTQWCG